MNTKHIKFTFSLLLTGILPLIGMNESDINKNCQFTFSDIQKIAETDIDKSILLETHLKDLKEIESYSPLTRKGSIDLILGHNFDKQQKLMGLIECASFICSPAQNDLIKYGLNHTLIPKEFLEGSDNTVGSFYKIKSVYTTKPQKTLQLVKELLPHSANIKDHSLNIDPVENDIKTIKYKNDEEKLENFHHLRATEKITIPIIGTMLTVQKIVINSEKLKQHSTTKKSVQELFNATSLPNKIALILRLNDLNKSLLKDINTVKALRWFNVSRRLENQVIAPTMYFLILWFHQKTDPFDFRSASLTATEFIHLIIFNKKIKFLGCILTLAFVCGKLAGLNFNNAMNDSLTIGSSLTLAPLPQLYFLYQYLFTKLPGDIELNQLKKEHANIQKLIEEFKESVKKEYND